MNYFQTYILFKCLTANVRHKSPVFSLMRTNYSASAIQKSKRGNKTTTEAEDTQFTRSSFLMLLLEFRDLRRFRDQRTNIGDKVSDLRVVETGGALQLEQREDGGRGVLEWWGGRS